MNREVTNDCIGLAFYGLSTDAQSVKVLYHDIIAWFGSVQCPPDKISVLGTGFSGKQVGFSRTHSRLVQHGFSNVKSFSICAMLPGGVIPILDWWASAGLDLGVGLRPYFALVARASVAKLEDDSLSQMVRSCISNLHPQYGIGFHRNHDQGPFFYAAGLNCASSPDQLSEAEYEKALTVSRWSDLGMVEEVYNQGVLRDVYPHNYLTDPQLKKQIEEQTLAEWISADSSRGTLESLNNEMVLWRVAEPQIESVRNSLSSAAVLFDWKTYLGD